MQGVLNLTESNYSSTSFSEACIALSRNTPLPPETGFYQKCAVNICCVLKMQLKCVLFGDPGTLFYTEGAVCLLKSHHGAIDVSVTEVLLEDCF